MRYFCILIVAAFFFLTSISSAYAFERKPETKEECLSFFSILQSGFAERVEDEFSKWYVNHEWDWLSKQEKAHTLNKMSRCRKLFFDSTLVLVFDADSGKKLAQKDKGKPKLYVKKKKK